MEPHIKDRIKKFADEMLADGTVLSRERVRAYVAAFRTHFGPEALSSLSGQELLTAIHEHGTKDSLVYWLEFKNDDEFPARFGSIAGGSALKFGIYRRKETGAWMTGTPRAQRAISVDEAVAIARRNRDQLVAGAKILDALPRDPHAVDYDELQRRLDEVAPDVAETSWGHKYFALLAYELLDDYS